MAVDQALVDAAVSQLDRRWPAASEAVAAAVYLDDGSTLTGVALDNVNAAMTLCAEIGPIVRAYTLERRIVASVCVSRSADRAGLLILAPCGSCQERLALWGPDVEVGVADRDDRRGWSSRRLVEVNPFYWTTAFTGDGTWPSRAEHAG